MKVEYTMHHQQIDKRLRFAASFTEGEPTRFDEPVNDETMVKECKSYEQTWPRRKVKMTRSDGRVIYDSTSNDMVSGGAHKH